MNRFLSVAANVYALVLVGGALFAQGLREKWCDLSKHTVVKDTCPLELAV